MGLLERWDEHNQRIMDRDRRLGTMTEWTLGAVLLIAFNLLWIVGDLPPVLAFAAQAAIVVVAVVGIVRISRRRRADHAAGTEVRPWWRTGRLA